MNNHVTNLELSKKLKEIGVQQDSEFYWIDFSQGTKENGAWSLESSTEGYNVGTYFSAFLSTELGEMLPVTINTGTRGTYSFAYLKTRKNNKIHECMYVRPAGVIAHFDAKEIFVKAKTEQDARAKMLIWLIENNLIEV